MKTVIAIRTHRWGPDEERLAAALSGMPKAELVVAFQNRPEGLELPLPVVDVSTAFVRAAGLAEVPDWGWRCGDYSLYALRGARPEAEFFWLVEPDVVFTGRPRKFFLRFVDDKTDALGYRPEPFTRDMRFTKGLGGIPAVRAIFALTRFSARAIDYAFERRRMASEGHVSMRYFPNDELFMFSHVAASGFLSTAGLEERAGDWFEGVQFDTDPDLLLLQVLRRTPEGKVLHPVRSRESFLNAMAGRLSRNASLLGAYHRALRSLSDEDVDHVLNVVAQNIRSDIARYKETPAARRAMKRAERA